MKILFFTTAHSEFSQRAYMELVERGHSVSISPAGSDSEMITAVRNFQPQLIVAPFLQRSLPASILLNHTILAIRPAAQSDRGSSSLRGEISENTSNCRISLLQGAIEKDSMEIKASPAPQLNPQIKRSFYKHHVAQAALQNLLDAIEKLEKKAAHKTRRTLVTNHNLSGRLHSLGL